MSTDEVILFPATHEQSLPTFHVREDLRFKLVEPPEHLAGTEVTEVLCEADTPLAELQKARRVCSPRSENSAIERNSLQGKTRPRSHAGTDEIRAI